MGVDEGRRSKRPSSSSSSSEEEAGSQYLFGLFYQDGEERFLLEDVSSCVALQFQFERDQAELPFFTDQCFLILKGFLSFSFSFILWFS